jgi:hypothetical protein
MPPSSATDGSPPASTAAGKTSKTACDSIERPAGAANVLVDLSGRVERGSLAERAKVSLVCLPDEARQRLKRLDQIGFDEVLVVSPASALDELERVRDFL